MTKKYFLTSLFTSLLLISAFAQSPEEFTGSLLWKVSGNELRKPSYILGSHHGTRYTFLDSIQGFYNAFKKTKQTVGEIDMSNMSAIQGKMFLYMTLPKDIQYKKVLTPEEYQLLNKKLLEYAGLGLKDLEQYHPTMLYYLFMPKETTITYQNTDIIDLYIQSLTIKKKKKLLGIETVEDQMRVLFSKDSIEKQIHGLICLLQNEGDITIADLVKKENEETDKITELYKKANLNGIAQWLKDYENVEYPCSEYYDMALFYKLLNNGRNEKWMERIPYIMSEASTLFVVGAMHLAGEPGILYQLSKLGYTVEPVR